MGENSIRRNLFLALKKRIHMKRLARVMNPEFEGEIAKSEYQRTKMMLIALIFGLVVALLNFFAIDDDLAKYYGGIQNYFIVVGWIATFILYEALVLRTIGKWIRQQKPIGDTFKLGHSFIEVSLPGLMILYNVDVNDMLVSLDSPIMLLYFLFIILSVLHLDFRVSLFTGVLAAFQFASIVFYGFHFANAHPDYIPNIPENSYYLRCVVLIISGGAAGFVASELRRRIRVSFDLERAKSNIELLFGQQVSREILLELVEEHGSARKQVATVLALDIRNFSAFAEKHGPDEIMEFQNKIFGPILDIIDQHQGVVNQILGDGIMATFGTPVPNPLHADMGFQAALKIREKVKDLVQSGVIPETRIGMGLHTGDVVTGNIGNANRKQYSISGSAVIIAFRVEQLNKDIGSELLITGKVKEEITTGKVPVTFLGNKSIKGFEYEVEIYQVGE